MKLRLVSLLIILFGTFSICAFAQKTQSSFSGKAHVKIKNNTGSKEADFEASTIMNDNKYINVRGDHYFGIKLFGKEFEYMVYGSKRKDIQSLYITSDDDANEFDMIGTDRTDDLVNEYPEFVVTMGDGFNVSKNNGDAIHFIIQKITNEDLELSFKATLGTGGEQSQVEGSVQLHRLKTLDLKTNSIIGCACDSIAHSKIDYTIGGMDIRTASQCEVLYHKSLGRLINKAFSPIKPSSEYKADFDNGKNKDWFYENWPEEFVLSQNIIGKNFHKTIFNANFSFNLHQNFFAPIDEKSMKEILLKVDAENKATFKEFPDKYTDEVRLQLSQGYIAKAYIKELDINVSINKSYNDDCVFIGPYKTLQIPGAAIAFQSSEVVLGHSGGPEPITIIYFGKWGKPEIKQQEKWDEGLATPIIIPSTIPKAAPKLALYNIAITIKGAPNTVNQLIDKINWNAFANALKSQLPCEN
jgi:hypothetical protein